MGLDGREDVAVHRRGARRSRHLRGHAAARGRSAHRPADLRRSRLHRRQRGPVPHVCGVHPAVLLRQRLRAGIARRIGERGRPVPARLLRRLRDGGAVGRADPRCAGRATCGRARLRRLSGGVLPLGERAARPRLLHPVVLARARRCGDGARPRAREHGRGEPRAGQELRRGHRRHPDRPQLRLEPRPGDHGLDLPHAERLARRGHPDLEGAPCRAGRQDRPRDDRERRRKCRGVHQKAGPAAKAIYEAVQLDVAESTRTIVLIMAGIMAVSFVAALLLLPGGKLADTVGGGDV